MSAVYSTPNNLDERFLADDASESSLFWCESTQAAVAGAVPGAVPCACVGCGCAGCGAVPDEDPEAI